MWGRTQASPKSANHVSYANCQGQGASQNFARPAFHGARWPPSFATCTVFGLRPHAVGCAKGRALINRDCSAITDLRKSGVCGLRRKFRRSSAAVATSREGPRKPRSGPEVQHRRWGRKLKARSADSLSGAREPTFLPCPFLPQQNRRTGGR